MPFVRIATNWNWLSLDAGRPAPGVQVFHDFAAGVGELLAQVKVAGDKGDYVGQGEAGFRIAADATVIAGGAGAARRLVAEVALTEGTTAGTVVETSSSRAGLSIDRSSRGTPFFDPDAAAKLDEAYRPAGHGGVDVWHSPEIEVPFGSGVRNQGYAYKNALASRLPGDSRLPPNFKTFDFFDQAIGDATSAKTLDATTPSRIANPSQVYSTLRRSVNAAADFNGYALGEKELLPEQIDLRAVRIAVPLETTAAQWEQIKRAIDHAQEQGIRLEPEVVTNSAAGH